MQQIEVHSRILQATEQGAEMPTVMLTFLKEELTVSDLIQRTVEEQIREMQVARKIDALQAQQTLNKQYLTQEEVQLQATAGIVRLPRSEVEHEREINVVIEVKKAQQGFTKHSYVIIVDGRPVTRLDEVIVFQPGSKVTFVRLMPLIGG